METQPDTTSRTVRATLAQVQRGEFSAQAWVLECLERIDALEPQVGAWQFLAREPALAQARRLDASGSPGPLAGLPLGVKDVIDTCDMPTTYGSAAYQGHQPPADASCVAQLRAAGAVCLGKTVTTEFAGAAPGKTRNPHNLKHTPGGSSSGSAAAVAAGMVPLAIGTQTAGSIIRPASFCGVTGYKPSFGLIDRTGVRPLATSFDTVGVLARTVEDAGYVVSVLSERPGLADARPPERPRIGVCRTPRWHLASEAMQQAFEQTVAILAQSGAVLLDWTLQDGLERLHEAHETLLGWEIGRAFVHDMTVRPEQLAARTREMILSRRHITADAYDAARLEAERGRVRFPQALGDFDALLTPAAAGEAPEGLASTGNPAFNNTWTLLHGPCVCVPAARSPAGLPLGVQLVGRRFDDARVLGVAAYVQAALRAAGAT